MKIGSLMVLLEQYDQNTELVIEIAKENGEKITTYDIGFSNSELGELMLLVHA